MELDSAWKPSSMLRAGTTTWAKALKGDPQPPYTTPPKHSRTLALGAPAGTWFLSIMPPQEASQAGQIEAVGAGEIPCSGGAMVEDVRTAVRNGPGRWCVAGQFPHSMVQEVR
jgi:hypothetical protein